MKRRQKAGFVKTALKGRFIPARGATPGTRIKKYHERCKRGLNAGVGSPLQGSVYFYIGYPGLKPRAGMNRPFGTFSAACWFRAFRVFRGQSLFLCVYRAASANFLMMPPKAPFEKKTTSCGAALPDTFSVSVFSRCSFEVAATA